MCVVSMVMNHQIKQWEFRENFPNLLPLITDNEIREFRELLERAREYDRRNNEPECELQEKRELLLALAKRLGVDISFV